MLFNSYEFLLGYLPVVVGAFFVLGTRGRRQAAITFLAISSLVFYGWWNPRYLFLLAGSIVFNFAVGVWLARMESLRTNSSSRFSRILLAFGILVDLAVLGYFKYVNFFVENLNATGWISLEIDAVLLPMGVSFFTFTQIAFLVDSYRGVCKEYKFAHYVLFVTYFPHLIAGPVLHHKEMMPQFSNPGMYVPQARHFAVGLTIFTIGLFKKVVIADSLAPFANAVFNASAQGAHLSFWEVWCGALAYTFQLYFDFSGYSDMAIGLSRLFGVRLPLNFDSPYKSLSIVEFWRRWHMTLSRFLRDYLYIAIGGSRNGPFRRYLNLLLTMLLGGMWHGAGWNFILWGGLHGCYLVVAHAWQAIASSLGLASMAPRSLRIALSWTLTFVAVVVAWVFFRAADLPTATSMLRTRSGMDGVPIPQALAAGVFSGLIGGGVLRSGGLFPSGLVDPMSILPMLLGCLVVVCAFPNSQEIVARYRPTLRRLPQAAPHFVPRWRPSLWWGAGLGIAFAISFALVGGESPFLYFQF